MTLYFLFPSSDIICKPQRGEFIVCSHISALFVVLSWCDHFICLRNFLKPFFKGRPQISKYFSLVFFFFFFNQNFVWTVSHGTDDLSSPTRNWTHSAFSGNIEVLSLNYSTAGKVCIFMSYTRFGCFQPRFWKIAVSAPFSFFSASGIPVEQMLDWLLLSQRFLRLLIFFF